MKKYECDCGRVFYDLVSLEACQINYHGVPLMGKITENMTVAEAANFLRKLAETCARNTQNWDAYEKVVQDMIQSALEYTPNKGPEA